MNVKHQGAKMSRRGFLKGAAVVSGAAAATALTPGAMADTRQPKTEKRHDEQPKGYHVTPHILEYYEKARF